MQIDIKKYSSPENAETNPQILFEGAVLAVMARVLETGSRIDLAVSDYLTRFPMDEGLTYLRPDMIICASDCLRLIQTAAETRSDANMILDDAMRAWRSAEEEHRLSVCDRTTRIQACIGNIRRALGFKA